MTPLPSAWLAACHAFAPCVCVVRRPAGDMGNLIQTDSTGHGTCDQTFDLLTFTAVNANIIGRAVVLHNGTDDGVTQTTGNSGTKMAVGVIGVSARVPPPVTPPPPAKNWTAVALISGGTAATESVTGTVTFSQFGGTGDVQIDVSISGLAIGT
ncbi:MAG: superoxide dismutase family protein, partial [Nevskia sp.]|nr:superoxide dismutase family protein [Nevskia sp.]